VRKYWTNPIAKIAIFAAMTAGFTQLSLGASACTDNSLDSYLALGPGGCTIGANTLSGFQVLAGTTGASEISPVDITVLPFQTSSSIGLSATTTVGSAAGSVQEFLFSFQLSGASYIGSAVTLANSFEMGDGAVTGLQNFCVGGPFGPDGVSGCMGMSGALATVDGAQNQDSAAFAATSLLTVSDDVTFDGGLMGLATGGTFVNEFTTGTSAIPEPTTFVLAGFGVALAGLRFCRFTRAGLSVKKGMK